MPCSTWGTLFYKHVTWVLSSSLSLLPFFAITIVSTSNYNDILWRKYSHIIISERINKTVKVLAEAIPEFICSLPKGQADVLLLSWTSNIKKKDKINIFVEKCLYYHKGLYSCLVKQLTAYYIIYIKDLSRKCTVWFFN